MSVVPSLRRNDPTVTHIDINLRNETSDTAGDLANALEENPFVTTISVNVEGAAQTTAWGALLRVIATRTNLEHVVLRDAYSVAERNAPPALVSAVLQAIQQNSAIRRVFLVYLRLFVGISTFVDTASSIEILNLYGCDMDPSEREQGARHLAAALQRNTSIQTLSLTFLDDVCMCSILQRLRANSTLKHILLGGNPFSDAVSRAIQQLLESTTSILVFGVTGSFNRDTMGPVAQGITQCGRAIAFYFRFCHFVDEESTTMFRSILQNKRNLLSLSLDDCRFSGGQVHDTIMSALLQPDSPLRTFRLWQRSFGDVIPSGQFQNLLRAIEKSKLEYFTIGYIQSQEQFQILTASIPLMRIKGLEIEVDSDRYDEANVKQLLLQAVKNNFSLRSVHGGLFERDIFNADDRTRFVFYADRNEHLDNG